MNNNFLKNLAEVSDPTDLQTYFEAAHEWSVSGGQAAREYLFDQWRRNKAIKRLISSCYESPYRKAYLGLVRGVEGAQRGITHKLEPCRLREWRTDLQETLENVEKQVFTGQVPKGIVCSHLIPRDSIVFNSSVVEQIKMHHLEGGMTEDAHFNHALSEVINREWQKENIILVDGDINRCEIEEIFSLEADHSDLEKEILKSLRSQLEK